jgi:hypothetical protein
MKAKFTDFINQFPNCSKFSNSVDAMRVFDFLSEDASIIKMIDAIESGKPALSPVVKQIEGNFQTNSFSFDDHFTKQAVGMMAKVVLGPFGYIRKPGNQKNLPKDAGATKFVTASCYQYFPDSKTTMRIVRFVEEI